MSKTAIIYATFKGHTQAVAEKIKKAIGDADVLNVKDIQAKDIAPYDVLLLGTSSIGHGDIQKPWKEILPEFVKQDFSDKKVALFGLGNCKYHGDTFNGGMSHLYKALKDVTPLLGQVSTDGYTYETSDSVVDGKFVGLALDEDNEPEKTDARIQNWLKGLGLI